MISFGSVRIEKCPKCGSKDIKVSGSTFSVQGCSVSVTCIECGHNEAVKT